MGEIAHFQESHRRIKEVANRLIKAIASEKDELILSGHSLGGAIVLEALEAHPILPNLHSVILLGTAYPRNNSLSRIQSITPRHYALNYYSPSWDLALNQAYYNAKGCTAIGSYGLLNPGIFKNVKANCTHSGRTGYARLVPGIVGLLAYSEGIKSVEKAKKPWQPIAIGNTGDWDNLYQFDEHILQRHCMTGYFRVIEAGGLHRERFYSKCVISLLNEVAALPK